MTPAGLPSAATAASVVATAVAGVVAGVASVALYGYDWGLALLTLTCVGSLLLLTPGAQRAAASGGWSLTVLWVARGGPGGDLVVPQELRTAFLLLVGVVLVLVTATTWPRERGDRGPRPLSSGS